MNVSLARSLSLLVGLSLPLVACGDSGGEGGSSQGGGGQGGGATSSTATTASTTTTGQGGGGGSTGQGGAGGGGCEVSVPSEYDGSTFAANAAGELAIRARGAALNDAMRAAELDLAVEPTLESLIALYEDGTPSIKSLTTTYYDGVILEVLEDFEAAAGNTWSPADPPVAPGGKYGSYLFDENGVDLRQTYEKGLFQSLYFKRFVEISEGTIDQAALDRMLAVYGAHPDFPGDSETTDTGLVPNPDRLAAQYTERRSPKNAGDTSLPLDPSNPGPYFRIKGHFITAQATLGADSDACLAARDEALSAIRDEWERSMAATVIYYFNDAAVKLTTEPATEALLSGGLHGYNEGVAFLHGFLTLPTDARAITDQQIEDLLELVGAPSGGPSEGYKLITDGATEVTNLTAAIEDLQDLYGFTDAEVLAFKTNY